LIDRGDTVELVTAVNQNSCITSKGRRIAGYCDDNRYRAFYKLACLRHGPLARRVEHNRLEHLPFARPEWTAGENADFRIDRLKPGRARCPTLQRLYGLRIAIRRSHTRLVGEA